MKRVIFLGLVASAKAILLLRSADYAETLKSSWTTKSLLSSATRRGSCSLHFLFPFPPSYPTSLSIPFHLLLIKPP